MPPRDPKEQATDEGELSSRQSTKSGKGARTKHTEGGGGNVTGQDASPAPMFEQLQPSQSQDSHRSTPSRSTWRRYLSTAKFLIADQWFLFALGFFILISSQVQVPASQQAMKETVVTYLCVAVIFFITGCTLSTKVLLANYGRWRIHVFVQIQSFLLTSAIVYAVVSLCALNPDFMDAGLLVGMIFTGCVPTTISSNVIMTKQANGNQALTVVQSTLGNFLGPFITPLLVIMYTSTGAWYTKVVPGVGSGGFGELYKRVLKQLGLSIFLPLFIGQVVQNVFPRATKKVFSDWKLSKLGSWSLLIIIWQTFDQAFQTRAFDSVKGNNIVFIVFMSIIFYTIWTITCFLLSRLWLNKADTIAVAYVVPAKTPAMGVPLSSVMFAGLEPITASKLQIPMVIFQGLQIAAGSLLTLVFRKWIGDEVDEEEKDIEEERQQDGGRSESGSV